jgi:tetratricopeptide (TPR) repeat protein
MPSGVALRYKLHMRYVPPTTHKPAAPELVAVSRTPPIPASPYEPFVPNSPLSRTLILVLAALCFLGALAFLPGIRGPFVFDDYSNLLDNLYVKVQSLDASSLWQAAFSLTAGPLRRPVAMVSFALNHYFAGDFSSTAPLKLTNIAIHGLNGILIFWFTTLVLRRAAGLASSGAGKRVSTRTGLLLASFVAIAWVMHPIQLTSVLYIVQRMTELSALFMLAAIIAYLHARDMGLRGKHRPALILLGLAAMVFWPLALFSKENAVLLPVFIAVLEWTLFRTEEPWRRLAHAPRTRHALIGVAIVVLSALAIFGYLYAQTGYGIRTFTMGERLLTEARVLFFYIGLVVAPRLDALGLLHDDIAVSTSLVSPWTTLPAIGGVAALLLLAIRLRNSCPLVSLGILWFFGAHLLESTIFPLEIAHEHRNYLAIWGILLTTIDPVQRALASAQKKRLVWASLALALAVFAGVTLTRANQWSGAQKLYVFEVLHHPDSAGAQAGFANVLLAQGKVDESMSAMRRASDLAPAEAGYLISLQTVASMRDLPLQKDDSEEISRRLASGPVSAVTQWALSRANDCIIDGCKSLQAPMEQWTATLIDRPSVSKTRNLLSYFYYFHARALSAQGKLNPAISAYRQSYEIDNNYYHPLFDLAYLFLEMGRRDLARPIVDELHRLNARTTHKRSTEIRQLEERLERANGNHPPSAPSP